ncbi:MAG: 30S ribosomal protein S20 [bacterium]
MAIHRSVLSRARQNRKRRERNVAVKSRLKTFIKKVNEEVAAGNMEGAQKALTTLVPAIDKAAAKGIIHRNNAARKVSKMTRKVKALTSSGF